MDDIIELIAVVCRIVKTLLKFFQTIVSYVKIHNDRLEKKYELSSIGEV